MRFGEFDYYPFGMVMPGRKYQPASGYRYGFNAKEKSNELYGDGNAYDYGNRIYDVRSGRWFKPDALEARLPMMSTYHFGLDNPLRYSDHKGNYVIDEATAKAYPNLKPVLAALLTELQKPENQAKVDELVKIGQFKDRQAFFEVLTDNKGPKLSVKNIVDLSKTVTPMPEVETTVQNPMGGTYTVMKSPGTTTQYTSILTDLGVALKVPPSSAAVTISTGEQKETVTITRNGVEAGKEEKVVSPFKQEVVLDDNLANVLNNTKIKMNKDGTINMAKATDALTYFLKVVLHETGHVGDDQASMVNGKEKGAGEVGRRSEDSYYSTDKQKAINGSQVLEENTPKTKKD